MCDIMYLYKRKVNDNKVSKTDSSMLDELAFNELTKKLTATFKGGAKNTLIKVSAGLIGVYY